MRLRALQLSLSLVGLALAHPALLTPAHANSAGPLSGSVRTGCGNGCHGMTPSPTITLDAPGEIDGSGTPVPIRVAVEDALVGGGGFMLEATAFGQPVGTMLVAPNSGVKKSAVAEVSHDGTQPLLRAWDVRWQQTGPVAGCAVDLRVAAMATNRDLYEFGDHWGSASADVAIAPSDDANAPSGLTFVSPKAGTITLSGQSLLGGLPATVVVGSARIDLAVTDDTGIRAVRLWDEDASGAEKALGAAKYQPSSKRWVLSWSTSGITPGPHTIRAVAEDCGGNVSEQTIQVLAF